MKKVFFTAIFLLITLNVYSQELDLCEKAYTNDEVKAVFELYGLGYTEQYREVINGNLIDCVVLKYSNTITYCELPVMDIMVFQANNQYAVFYTLMIDNNKSLSDIVLQVMKKYNFVISYNQSEDCYNVINENKKYNVSDLYNDQDLKKVFTTEIPESKKVIAIKLFISIDK